jgi:hypothetical protein
LTRALLVWDLDEDEWFADCPILLDFEGEQVEINHWKFDEVSITWNTIDPARSPAWPDFHLAWRDNAPDELAALVGQPLSTMELLEWRCSDLAQGTVSLGFSFSNGQVTIYNKLDENGMEFTPPDDPLHAAQAEQLIRRYPNDFQDCAERVAALGTGDPADPSGPVHDRPPIARIETCTRCSRSGQPLR